MVPLGLRAGPEAIKSRVRVRVRVRVSFLAPFP